MLHFLPMFCRVPILSSAQDVCTPLLWFTQSFGEPSAPNRYTACRRLTCVNRFGKDWRQEEKWTTEDEMIRWYHQLNGHEFQQALGVGDGTGKPGVLQSIGYQSQTRLSNWTELIPNSKHTNTHTTMACQVLKWFCSLLQVKVTPMWSNDPKWLYF